MNYDIEHGAVMMYCYHYYLEGWVGVEQPTT